MSYADQSVKPVQMQAPSQTVFIVDDEESVRSSLRWLLESIHLKVATFESAEAFLKTYSTSQAGCLVLDVRMPGMSGPELMDRLNADGINIPMIFLSAHGDVPLAVRAMKGGAIDFLQKPYNNQTFLERVRQALSRDAGSRQQQKYSEDVSARLAALTLREREVLALIVEGQSNKLIARQLDISHKTVEAHRGRLMRKMGANSFAELLHLMLTNGEHARPN